MADEEDNETIALENDIYVVYLDAFSITRAGGIVDSCIEDDVTTAAATAAGVADGKNAGLDTPAPRYAVVDNVYWLIYAEDEEKEKEEKRKNSVMSIVKDDKEGA